MIIKKPKFISSQPKFYLFRSDNDDRMMLGTLRRKKIFFHVFCKRIFWRVFPKFGFSMRGKFIFSGGDVTCAFLIGFSVKLFRKRLGLGKFPCVRRVFVSNDSLAIQKGNCMICISMRETMIRIYSLVFP